MTGSNPLGPQRYYNNIEGAFHLNMFFIYEATPICFEIYLMQMTSIDLKLQIQMMADDHGWMVTINGIQTLLDINE